MTEDLIEIPFNSWSKDKLRAGKKNATSRTKKYGERGDCFEVDLGDKVVRYEVVFISRWELDRIAINWYDVEGCDSPEEFKNVWGDIHPRKGFDPDQKVWFHLFEKVEEREK